MHTFKSERNYKSPTESVFLKECTTIKSAEDEINKEYSFVKTLQKKILFFFYFFLTWNQKLESAARTFYMIAETNAEKESWIGAIGF